MQPSLADPLAFEHTFASQLPARAGKNRATGPPPDPHNYKHPIQAQQCSSVPHWSGDYSSCLAALRRIHSSLIGKKAVQCRPADHENLSGFLFVPSQSLQYLAHIFPFRFVHQIDNVFLAIYDQHGENVLRVRDWSHEAYRVRRGLTEQL